MSNKFKNVANDTSNIYNSNISINNFCKDLEISHFIINYIISFFNFKFLSIYIIYFLD